MNKTIKKISAVSLFLLVAGLFAFPVAVAFAQDFSQPYTPLTTIPGLYEEGKATNPVAIVKGIYGLAIGIGSVIATVMIIYAGFEYMYVEAIGQKSAAKERITNAFLGLLVILGSYILLRTINPALVDFNITLEQGTGRVANLIAVQKEFEDAQARIREAQKNVLALNVEVSDLDQKIASSTSATTTAALELERDSKAAKASYMKAIALTDHAIKAVESYLINEDTGLRIDVEAYFKNSLESINEARAKTEVVYNKTRDPKISSQIESLDAKKIVLVTASIQLLRVRSYQNADGITGSTFKSQQAAVSDIKAAGEDAIRNLRQLGDRSEIAEITQSTSQRVKIICPSCK